MTRCLILCVILAIGCQSISEAAPPNIVFILADDLGYGDLSCFGQTTLKTPHLDRMAAEGLKLTRHYAGSTVCAPSRCVLLTGKHTGHCSVRGNGPGLLQDSDITVAQLLQDAGYATACVGKWGVGNPPPLNDPNRRGFDHFSGYVSMWHAHNFYPEFLIRDGKKLPLRNIAPDQWKNSDGRGVATTRIDYAPQLLADDAIAFVRSHRDRPFFLYWAMNVPHANNEARNEGMEVPDLYEFTDRDWPAPEKGFAAMIRNIDQDVGRMLETLKAAGLEENTLVVFTSDNGPHQEGGHKADFFDSNGILRGQKRDLYEGGIRVPTIARWPKTVQAGTTSDVHSGFQDWLPTFAELSGTVQLSALDGVSLVPTLTGKLERQKQHPFLYWEFQEQGGKQAVLKGQWKAVRLNWSKQPDGPVELYDLNRDPSETLNVAAEHPEIVDELTRAMATAHTPVN
jgi:arylsulfatase A-like enzyme